MNYTIRNTFNAIKFKNRPLHFISVLQATLLINIFLLYVSSRSNNLATTRIECSVVQFTKKTMQGWSMSRYWLQKMGKRKQHYLKERKFCWKKFMRKICSLLSSKKLNFCENIFCGWHFSLFLSTPQSSCAPLPHPFATYCGPCPMVYDQEKFQSSCTY